MKIHQGVKTFVSKHFNFVVKMKVFLFRSVKLLRRTVHQRHQRLTFCDAFIFLQSNCCSNLKSSFLSESTWCSLFPIVKWENSSLLYGLMAFYHEGMNYFNFQGVWSLDCWRLVKHDIRRQSSNNVLNFGSHNHSQWWLLNWTSVN